METHSFKHLCDRSFFFFFSDFESFFLASVHELLLDRFRPTTSSAFTPFRVGLTGA